MTTTNTDRAANNALLAQATGYRLRLRRNDSHLIAPDGTRRRLAEIPDFYTDRAVPINLQAEPSYPGLAGSVTFSIRAPEMTAHQVSAECGIECPHLIAECGIWKLEVSNER